jgi:hypothetical protein
MASAPACNLTSEGKQPNSELPTQSLTWQNLAW